MPGEIKRKYDNEMQKISSNIYKQIKMIFSAIPEEYDLSVLINVYKECYSMDYNNHVEMIKNYKKKNDFLIRRGKKPRYKIDSVEKLFLNNPGIRNMLKSKFIEERKANFNFNEIEAQKIILTLKEKNINRRKKVEANKKFIQCCDPCFFDKLIGFYSRKKASIVDKELVIEELLKFDGPKTYSFLMKLNDTEKNRDIRYKVFYGLQSLGHYVKLRKEFEGKKKPYSFESYSPENEILDSVGERIIVKSKFELLKSYNIFISHNIADKELALEMVKDLNTVNLSSYFCWISDGKKGYSKYLKDILDLRMHQSDIFIIVKTDNYKKSEWCSYEFEFISKCGKKFYIVSSKEEYMSLRKEIMNNFNLK